MADNASDWRKSAFLDYVQKRSDLRERIEDANASIQRLMREFRELSEQVEQLDAAAKVFGLPVDGDSVKTPTPPQAKNKRQFKHIAFDVLKRAYPNTVKASEIQEEAERQLGRKFHDKTAGMTLYRFLQKRIAERVGHSDWRYIPPKEEGRGESQPSIFG